MKPDPIQAVIQKVQKTAEWERLVNTVENTPWHREANVAVHTTLTLMCYYVDVHWARSEVDHRHTLMALLFHDFGKPDAQRVDPVTGRNRYTGHEAISSALMTEFFAKHEDIWQECLKVGYTIEDLDKVRWLIDNHLPYYIVKASKLKRMKEEAVRHFGNTHAFYDMLRCDARGRISDDHEEKLQAVEDWIKVFDAIVVQTDEEILRVRAQRKAAWFAKLNKL